MEGEGPGEPPSSLPLGKEMTLQCLLLRPGLSPGLTAIGMFQSTALKHTSNCFAVCRHDLLSEASLGAHHRLARAQGLHLLLCQT